MSDNTQLDMFEQVDGKVYIREPRGQFLLVHFPNSWDMVEGEWLPQLTEMPVMPGSNLVSGDTDNPNIDQLLKLIERKGGVVVSPHDKRLGEYQGFLKKRGDLFKIAQFNSDHTPKCSHHYLGCGLTYETYKVAYGKNTLSYGINEQRYNEFRKLLVTSGIVKPITNERILAIVEAHKTVEDRMFAEKEAKILFLRDMLTWLDKQIEIIDNERAFLEKLIKTAPMTEAAIYTLHMSNPPPLEEVMKVTGLGKTSIYSRLKLLRAMEKDRDPRIVYIGDHCSEVSYGKKAYDKRSPDERKQAEQSAEEMWNREKNIK